jgi:hypothetical protein
MIRYFFGILLFVSATTLSTNANVREDAKKQTDAEITKLLVGKWAVEVDEMGVKVKGTQEYTKDGKFAAEATIEAGKNTIKLTVSGTWVVKDGMVIETVKKSNQPMIVPEGKESKDKVISIDDKVYKFKDEMDKERTVKRIKDK